MKKTTEQYIKTDGKITNKIFANQIQEDIKTILYNNEKKASIQRFRNGSTHVNQ